MSFVVEELFEVWDGIVSGEFREEIVAFLKTLCSCLFSLCYSLGGMHGKWKRRYLGSAWLVGAMCGFSAYEGKFDAVYLLMWPFLVLGLSLGYGADTTWDKFVKRLLCGAVVGASSSPVPFISGRWLLFSFHLLLCIATSTFMGVLSPTPNARSEESLIGLLYSVLPLFLY